MSNQTFFLPGAELRIRPRSRADKRLRQVEVREVTKAELSLGEACRISPSDATSAEVEEEEKRFRRVQVFRHAPGADEWIEVWLRVD